MVDAPVAPPVVELGRRAGWDPLPLSVRDARRVAGPLRERLAPLVDRALSPATAAASNGDVVAEVRGLAHAYGPVPALRGVDLTLHGGEVVALMGRNGSGKSTLLGVLAGLWAPGRGRVRVGDEAPASLGASEARRLVGLVPQDPSLLLWRDRVDAELSAADREVGAPDGSAAGLLERLVPGVPGDRHPRDLSEGQRLALALAVVLVARPDVVLLDEPTRGLDYRAKGELVCALRGLADDGHAVVLSTHDVEMAAAVADRAVVLADGEVVADGPARDVVTASPVFAPQVSKVLAPLSLLTVAEVVEVAERGGAPLAPDTVVDGAR